jgi:hypothetical protein
LEKKRFFTLFFLSIKYPVTPVDIIHTRNSPEKIKPNRKVDLVTYRIIRGITNVLIPSPMVETEEERNNE